jgi:hypothetical protein
MQQFRGVDLFTATFGASNNLALGPLGAPQTGGTITLRYANRQRVLNVLYPTGRVVLQ